MARIDGRRPDALRPVEIIRGFTTNAPGSVMIRTGDTHVLCTACWESAVPPWKKGEGTGWVTAEYDMLPGATSERRRRNRTHMDGRTQEIQRLIGRSLRAVVDFGLLGENSILIDCDVIQADGGTRTASITGAYVAMCDAVRVAIEKGYIERTPIREAVAAVSVGRVSGRTIADLNYPEDAAAEVDMNVVMTASGGFVEVQGTAEGRVFSREELNQMLDLARRSIKRLFAIQRTALGGRRA